MSVKEKLVELLSEIIDGGFKWHNYCYESGEQLNNDEIASYLISHGVTVQECSNWKYYHKQNKAVCTSCNFERDLDANFGKAIACPNCGAKMDLKD